MNFVQTLGFVAGTLANPIALSGIVAIGVLANKKKISFALGFMWGTGFIVYIIGGLQYFRDVIDKQPSDFVIPSELYLVPFSCGFLTLFLTWIKTLLVKGRGKTGNPSP